MTVRPPEGDQKNALVGGHCVEASVAAALTGVTPKTTNCIKYMVCLYSKTLDTEHSLRWWPLKGTGPRNMSPKEVILHIGAVLAFCTQHYHICDTGA